MRLWFSWFSQEPNQLFRKINLKCTLNFTFHFILKLLMMICMLIIHYISQDCYELLNGKEEILNRIRSSLRNNNNKETQQSTNNCRNAHNFYLQFHYRREILEDYTGMVFDTKSLQYYD
ncbi:CLUMA_CG010942, isoform A [Clunio marinus]|uniref:CLUMA_CG010942, isoform A n=1 Tax=Clunio marinus TaxID=568069 RepID=A0A1J1IDB9_9DIPT|nr:CLUMA_CG010942, isoform A [Clunio marinus]